MKAASENIHYRLTAIFLGFCFLTACKEIKCSNQYLTPVFVGFSYSDLDTLVIRRFKKADNFSNLYDTAMITDEPQTAFYSTSNDTTLIVLNVISGEEKYLFPENDWQIYIPAQNRIVSLSDMISPQTEEKCFGDNCGCANPIISFLQDGQMMTPDSAKIPFGGIGPVTYIK